MATVATISVNFAQYDSISFTPTGVIDRSINPRTLSQYCLGSASVDLSYVGGFVKKTGDTMSGHLTLPSGNPLSLDHATRKGYVDSRIDSLSATVNDPTAGGFVRIAGSTMSGGLILNTSLPSLPLQASSKGYVDSRITSLSSTTDTKLSGEYLALNGGTMRGSINMNGNKIFGYPINATFSDGDLVSKKYVDSTISAATAGGASVVYVNQETAKKVSKSGDTMTGRLAQSSLGFHSAVKDDITTRTDSGFYQTSVAKKSTGWPSDTNAWYHLFSNTHINDANYYSMQFASSFYDSNELYYRSTNGSGTAAWNKIFHSGNTTVTSFIGYIPVNKGGDTMSGFLTLPASDPTNENHATRKKYVDDKIATVSSSASTANNLASTKVSKSGDTMSGTLTIAGTTGRIGVNTGYTGATIDVQASSTGIDSNAAYMTFHRPNKYAVKFGLDTDNVLKVGGWSMQNVAHTIITSDNIKNFAPTSTQVDGKVAKAGDTMSGALTITHAGNLWGENNSLRLTTNSDPGISFYNTSNNRGVNLFIHNGQNAVLVVGGGYLGTNAHAIIHSGNLTNYINGDNYVKKSGDNMTGNLHINNASPTIFLQDTDHRSAMLHTNSNYFYILRGAVNGTDWGGNDIAGRWPFVLNLENGDVTAAGDVTAYSDERLKKNITPIENALEKTLKLQGVSYDKIESGEKSIGLIAQKVKEVLPEVVKEDNKGFHTLNYPNMIGLLVEAIKELNGKVEKLENKNI